MSGGRASPRLARATDLVALPVVTLSGDDVAEVRDVVYDRTSGSLVGFTLNGRGFLSGRMKRVLGTEAITSIGADAVMVADNEALAEPGDAPQQMADAPDDGSVIGTPVITDGGTRLGEVADVIVSLGASARAVGYELTGTPNDGRGGQRAFVPLPEQLALSGNALMVPDELEHMVRDDLTGFGAAIDEFWSSRSNNDRRERNTGGDSGGRYDGASKAELYEEAKSRDIPRRSSMTKAELRDALEHEEVSA
jgi:uncharacterized protein YrrD